jgi:hypothetical protein
MPDLKPDGIIILALIFWAHARRLPLRSPALRRYISLVSTLSVHPMVAKELMIHPQAAPQYTADNFHYALSSSQESACSVEPGSAEDVSKIVS